MSNPPGMLRSSTRGPVRRSPGEDSWIELKSGMFVATVSASPTATCVTGRRTAAMVVSVTAVTFVTNGSLCHRTGNDRPVLRKGSRFWPRACTTVTSRKVCHARCEAGESLTPGESLTCQQHTNRLPSTPSLPLLAAEISHGRIIAVKNKVCPGRSTVTAGKVCATGAARITGRTDTMRSVFPTCRRSHAGARRSP